MFQVLESYVSVFIYSFMLIQIPELSVILEVSNTVDFLELRAFTNLPIDTFHSLKEHLQYEAQIHFGIGKIQINSIHEHKAAKQHEDKDIYGT